MQLLPPTFARTPLLTSVIVVWSVLQSQPLAAEGLQGIISPGSMNVLALKKIGEGSSSSTDRIVLLPGASAQRVNAALYQFPFLSGDIDLHVAEGMAAPGVYDLAPNEGRTDLLVRMEARQQKVLIEAWEGRSNELGLVSPYDLLIVASMVEAEAATFEDRAAIASVILNRLEQGMPLQSDATVIYGLTRGGYSLGRGLRSSELTAKTNIFNTYIYVGLPPTAINNPSEETMEVVAQGPQFDYLFFVADGDGGYTFASSLDEHYANVAAYRERLAGTKVSTEAAEPEVEQFHPLAPGERDRFRAAVQRCWVVDPGSPAAEVTVVVSMNLTPEATPDSSSITLLRAVGGDDAAIREAYEAARRAVLRCGADGFPLPANEYEHWRTIEMTFNPEGMRVR